MANRFTIRHGSGTPTEDNLLPYELGWDGSSLYINNNGNITKVGGEGSFLPITGGTMTGSVVFNNETRITYKIARKKEDGGGWVYSPFRTVGNDDAMFFNIGVYGTADTLTYGYIGAGDYNSDLNLKIAPDGSVTAKKFVGPLEGIATQATEDGNGNVITSTYLPLIGGTLTGNLTLSQSDSPILSIKNTTMDTAVASISATQYNAIYFRDKNDLLNGFLQGYEYTNGNTYMELATRRRNTNDSANVQNSLTLAIAADGSATISVSHPAAWCTGLGAVNISGDTMIGNLAIQKSNPIVRVQDTVNNIAAELQVSSDHQNHGVYSNGYAPTASTFTADAKWIIYRNASNQAASQLEFTAPKVYHAVWN